MSSGYSEADWKPSEFLEILFENKKGLDTHAEYFMTERDMAHDNGIDKNPDLRFTVTHPDADGVIHSNVSDEGTQTFNYLKDKEVSLYFVRQEVKYNNKKKDDNNQCIIDASDIGRCNILNVEGDEPYLTGPFKKEADGSLDTFMYYDSGPRMFHKFNITWANLFDPSTTKNDRNSFTLSGIFNTEKWAPMNKTKLSSHTGMFDNFINAKWQQNLIFSWYGKVGCNNTNPDSKEKMLDIWNKAVKGFYNEEDEDFDFHWRMNVQSSGNVESSKINHKCFFIAVNLMRLLKVTYRFEKSKIISTGQFTYFSDNQMRQDYHKEISTNKDYFKNPIEEILQSDDTLNFISPSFDLPISQSDGCNGFLAGSLCDYNAKARTKKKSTKASQLTNIVRKNFEIICEDGLKLSSKQIKITLMYVGLLFKYSIGDTSFIVAQLYDKKLRPRKKTILRSLDNFLSMRSLMFEGIHVFGEASKKFKLNLKHTLPKNTTGEQIGLTDGEYDDKKYTYYFSIKANVTVQDINNQIDFYKQYLDTNISYKENKYYKILDESYKNLVDDENYYITTISKIVDNTVEIKVNEDNRSFFDELKKIKSSYNDLSSIIDIYEYFNKFTEWKYPNYTETLFIENENGIQDSVSNPNLEVNDYISESFDTNNIFKITEKLIFYLRCLYNEQILNFFSDNLFENITDDDDKVNLLKIIYGDSKTEPEIIELINKKLNTEKKFNTFKKKIKRKCTDTRIRIDKPNFSINPHEVGGGGQNTTGKDLVLNQSNLIIYNIIKHIYNEIKEILSFFSSIVEINTRLYNDVSDDYEVEPQDKQNLIFQLYDYIKNSNFFEKKIQYNDQFKLRKDPSWLRNLPDNMPDDLQLKMENIQVNIGNFMISLQNVLEKSTLSSEYGWLSYEKFNPIFYNLKNNFDSFISIYNIEYKYPPITGGGQEGGADTRKKFVAPIIKEILIKINNFYTSTSQNEFLKNIKDDTNFLNSKTKSELQLQLKILKETTTGTKNDLQVKLKTIVESNYLADNIINDITTQDVILFFSTFLYNFKSINQLSNIKIKSQKFSYEIYKELITETGRKIDIRLQNLLYCIYEKDSFSNGKEDFSESVQEIFTQTFHLFLIIYFRNNLDFDKNIDNGTSNIVQDIITSDNPNDLINKFLEEYDIEYLFFNGIDDFINGIYFYSYNHPELKSEVAKLNDEMSLEDDVDMEVYYSKLELIHTNIKNNPTLDLVKGDFYYINCGLEENIIRKLIKDIYIIFVSQKFKKNTITSDFLDEGPQLELLKVNLLENISDIELLYDLYVTNGIDIFDKFLRNMLPVNKKSGNAQGITSSFLNKIKDFFTSNVISNSSFKDYLQVINDETFEDTFNKAILQEEGNARDRITVLILFLSKLKTFRDLLDNDYEIYQPDLSSGGGITNTVDLVNNYNNITNPVTNQQISVSSLLGKYILRKYIDKTQ